MEGYAYPYPQPFPPMASPAGGDLPDHGDGFGDYYGMSVLKDGREAGRSDPKRRSRRSFHSDDSRSQSEGSRSASKSDSRSRTRSRSGSDSRSVSQARTKTVTIREPSFLDAFRVLYITPSKIQKSTNRFLSTKKRQDKVHEILKSDGLGSKRWFLYPRSQTQAEGDNPDAKPVPGPRDNCDQRIKIDGEFFRKYKRRNKVDVDSPIAKLKRWELILYKKLGFIQAV